MSAQDTDEPVAASPSAGAQVALPKLAELHVDEQTEATIKTLVQYIQVLESNQVELVKMVSAITTELPVKLQQKVDKYMQYYQQNVIDKQSAELTATLDRLEQIATK